MLTTTTTTTTRWTSVGPAFLLFVISTNILCGHCLNSITNNLNQQLNDSNLLSVIVIYRHGDRTPVDPYPTDPYRNVSYWPVGFGQLTNLGKQQHYELGKYLRARYASLLPVAYDGDDIYVRSTDVDRTLMSAQANLAGLYPPRDARDVWNPSMDWQPIPVHAQAESDDPVLAMKTNCPRYNYLLDKLMQDAYFVDVERRNRPLYEYVSNQTGSRVDSLQSLEFIYNTLFIEELYNFTLPAWTQRVYPAVMRPMAALSFAIACFNSELARLKAGPLFHEILMHLRNSSRSTAVRPDATAYHPRGAYIESVAKRNSARKPKLWMYSAHDTTIANVLNTLKVFDYHSPPYASSVLIELHHRIADGGHFIRLYYRNSSTPRLLHIPGCEVDCDLETFESLLKPVSVSIADWYEECEQVSVLSLFSLATADGVVVFILIMFVMMIISMIIVCMFFSKPKYEQQAYLRLPDNDETV